MAEVAICGMMPEETTKEDACEEIARDALELLQREHGINVGYYNWTKGAQIREKCADLVDKFKENKYIYDFIHSRVQWW
jgi:glutamate formiminotransferase